MIRSLKRSLALWWLAIMLMLGGLMLIEAWSSAHRSADQALDGQLEAASLTIAEAMQWSDGMPLIEIPASALEVLATRWQERVFYELIGADGQLITRNAELPVTDKLKRAVSKAPVYVDASYHGETIRLHGREVSSAGWDTQEPVQVWVAHTCIGRDELARTLIERTLTRILATMLIAGVILIFAMRAWMMPIRRLRSALRERELEDTRPLLVDVPEEMNELTDTLNHLFGRQRQHRDSLLRFIADASHQLKTPLAGLRSISELSLKSPDPRDWQQALTTIQDETDRTSRLATQLLNLTRLRHQVDLADTDRIALDRLLKSTVLEWAERQDARDHDIGVEIVGSGPFVVCGEEWALHELINNLIDNALRYTPAGTVITLGLRRLNQQLELFIEDNGPGVGVPDPASLIRPFERAGRQDTCGSGLGLAIVASIAERHHGQLQLSHCQPSGLRVSLLLAVAESGHGEEDQ
ncbi:sensor histidine kinase N-terminal domain-containing protein [Pokkaliibacter sp. MBI-7]|uniref:sensor histidine kinase n=1 Tax=Pokkaliibacter sp. MBI-7 TaxID=3040600 RepID=UPI002448ABCB|nr:sensor histidine kinase [Pokkaliibacter sp. MBI-7]MDH2436337.1 sensor histidine kinase N-terminal domain-containing protein [Pokkaliibacter sp. MBI-7]